MNNFSQVRGSDRGREICTKVPGLVDSLGTNVNFDRDGNGRWFTKAISDVVM